jgi:hypothetical protein
MPRGSEPKHLDRRHKPRGVLRHVPPIVWAPQPGSQLRFLQCEAFECLFHGNRGGGKTEALIFDFVQDVWEGLGADWTGILFRRTFPELKDVMAKCFKWFPLIFGNRVRFIGSPNPRWEWDTGEKLFFSHMRRIEDFEAYRGHSYAWIGWEELTNWPDDRCYTKMFSCCRTANPKVLHRIRATTNPSSVGHGWVKHRFRLTGDGSDQSYSVIRYKHSAEDSDEEILTRTSIKSSLEENKILTSTDKGYASRIRAAASSKAEYLAWVKGSWDIVSGGMYDDLFLEYRDKLVVPRFDIPRSWKLDRSFDWGSTHPFSVGWWAESDGSDVQTKTGKWRSTVRGDLYRIHEYYGWTGTPNQGLRMLNTEIATKIVEIEIMLGIHGRVEPGPADTSIFDSEPGKNSIAKDMLESVRIGNMVYPGVEWTRADKGDGSRVQGWQQIRKMLTNAIPPDVGAREHPGLFCFDHCAQYLRLLPTLQRDEKNPDDADSNSEDHLPDEVRYRVRKKDMGEVTKRSTGIH